MLYLTIIPFILIFIVVFFSIKIAKKRLALPERENYLQREDVTVASIEQELERIADVETMLKISIDDNQKTLENKTLSKEKYFLAEIQILEHKTRLKELEFFRYQCAEDIKELEEMEK